MLKLGDKGIAVEYINYILGVNSSTFTEETQTRLKQFQASYNQKFIDKSEEKLYAKNALTNEVYLTGVDYNPYDEYFKPGDNYFDFNPKLFIYPNGVVDIFTLPALTGIELETFDTNKIRQVQEVLSFSKYNNFLPLNISSIYDNTTNNAIKNYQIAHDIYQEFIPILEHKNVLSNLPQDWTQGTLDNTGSSVETNYSIISSYLGIDSNFNHYIKSFSSGISLQVHFFTSTYTFISSAICQTYFGNKDSFIIWYDGIPKVEGQIPYCQTNSVYKVAFIKISVTSTNMVTPNDIKKLNIQLEKNNTATIYEPFSLNEYNKFYSGFLNIPTYNALKKEFNLEEVD